MHGDYLICSLHQILHVDAYNFLLNRRIYYSESTCRLVLIIVSITKIPKTSVIGALSSSIHVKIHVEKNKEQSALGICIYTAPSVLL